MLHALLLGAALLAAAPLDTRHAALLDALTSGHGGMSCTPAELGAAAADAGIHSAGRVDGDDVVVAHLNGGCLCGAHNCPVYALRLTAGKPRVLMTTFGYRVTLTGGTPLLRILVRSHDSALISNEETYAYLGGAYVHVENARIRSDTGARKSDIALRFPPGASSAQLQGSASRDWDDAYTFDASNGQQLVVGGVRSRAQVALMLLGAGGLIELRPGTPVTLHANGTYVLRVRPAAEQTVPYALTLAITNKPAPPPANRSGTAAAAERPAPALIRWAQSIQEVRCVPTAFNAWSGRRTDKDTSGVPITLVSGKNFARSEFSAHQKLTLVAGTEPGDGDRYYLARVPASGAVVMGFVGTGNEDTFTAVIGRAGAPPRAVVALPAAPRAGGSIGLGSTRAAVESVLGPGRANTVCGFDVVHYSQSEPRASVAEMWFFYRNGVVTAIARASGA